MPPGNFHFSAAVSQQIARALQVEGRVQGGFNASHPWGSSGISHHGCLPCPSCPLFKDGPNSGAVRGDGSFPSSQLWCPSLAPRGAEVTVAMAPELPGAPTCCRLRPGAKAEPWRGDLLVLPCAGMEIASQKKGKRVCVQQQRFVFAVVCLVLCGASELVSSVRRKFPLLPAVFQGKRKTGIEKAQADALCCCSPHAAGQPASSKCLVLVTPHRPRGGIPR